MSESGSLLTLITLTRLATSLCYLALSLVTLTRVDFTPGLVLNKSSRGTHLSCSLTETSENCAAIYRLRETSYLPSSDGGIISNLTQPENQTKLQQTIFPNHAYHRISLTVVTPTF